MNIDIKNIKNQIKAIDNLKEWVLDLEDARILAVGDNNTAIRVKNSKQGNHYYDVITKLLNNYTDDGMISVDIGYLITNDTTVIVNSRCLPVIINQYKSLKSALDIINDGLHSRLNGILNKVAKAI